MNIYHPSPPPTVTMLTELIGLSLGTTWIVMYYTDCPADAGKKIMFGKSITGMFTR